MWSQLLTQFNALGMPAHSLLTVNMLERSTRFPPAPSLPAPSALPVHPLWKWKTTTLLGDTTSWGLCPYERALNKMHSIHVVQQADGFTSKMGIFEEHSTSCAHPLQPPCTLQLYTFWPKAQALSFCFQFWRSAFEWIEILYQALVSIK